MGYSIMYLCICMFTIWLRVCRFPLVQVTLWTRDPATKAKYQPLCTTPSVKKLSTPRVVFQIFLPSNSLSLSFHFFTPYNHSFSLRTLSFSLRTLSFSLRTSNGTAVIPSVLLRPNSYTYTLLTTPIKLSVGIEQYYKA